MKVFVMVDAQATSRIGGVWRRLELAICWRPTGEHPHELQEAACPTTPEAEHPAHNR